MIGPPRVDVVVPSLGRSPHAAAALEALRAELAPLAGQGELLWVAPRSAPPPIPLAAERGERWLTLEREEGFAVAANRGFAATVAQLVAFVNDDAIVEAGWLAPLIDALDNDDTLAAAQGVIVELRDEAGESAAPCDGCGIGWNRWWQAIQLGRGAPPPSRSSPPIEPFGAQATAALYRRAALERVTRGVARPFDERLESWYEDVDLAVRLRAAGFGAQTLPSVRARHAGSTTGAAKPWRRRRLLARNRILVVARVLGRRFPLALPRLFARDLADGARSLAQGDAGAGTAIVAGWIGAIPGLPRFAHLGAALPVVVARAESSAPMPIGSAE